METKAKALKEGIYYAWAVRVHDVVFESDSKIIISALNGMSEASVSFDIIVVGIRNKLQDFRCTSISHVKWNSNYLVHHLVQYAKKHWWLCNLDRKNPNMVEYALAHDVLFLSSS